MITLTYVSWLSELCLVEEKSWSRFYPHVLGSQSVGEKLEKEFPVSSRMNPITEPVPIMILITRFYLHVGRECEEFRTMTPTPVCCGAHNQHPTHPYLTHLILTHQGCAVNGGPQNNNHATCFQGWHTPQQLLVWWSGKAKLWDWRRRRDWIRKFWILKEKSTVLLKFTEKIEVETTDLHSNTWFRGWIQNSHCEEILRTWRFRTPLLKGELRSRRCP